MQSKVNFGHPKWPIDQKWPERQSKVIENGRRKINNSEMARIAIESKFQTSKMIDLKWPEMQSKVIFEHPKYPPVKHFENKLNSVLILNSQKCDRK